MSNHYLDNLAREVNERLQQRGTLPVPSLTKEYDLPTEFLLDQVRLFMYIRALTKQGFFWFNFIFTFTILYFGLFCKTLS